MQFPRFITTIKSTLSQFKNPVFYIFLLLGTIIDAVFFYVLTIIHVNFFLPATQELNTVMVALQNASQDPEIAADINQISSTVLGRPEVTFAYHSFLQLLGIFFVSTLAAILIIQSIAWLIAQSAAKPSDGQFKVILRHKREYIMYVARFTLATLCWTGAFLLIVAITSLLQQNALSAPLPLLSTTTITGLFVLVLVAITYAVTILYATPVNVSLKNAFKRIINRTQLTHLAIPFCISFIVIFDVAALWFPIFRWNYSVSIAWLFILVLPSVTLMRIYLINNVSEFNSLQTIRFGKV